VRAQDLIAKKRDGGELTADEIRYLVHGYTRGEIPDYQMAAFLMAVYFRGMSAAETTHLTWAIVESGERVDLSGAPGVKVDKHSTGGVGDKTTLALVPLVAAAGVPVAKMSGRALGHTGGTVDKLESIPGFRTGLSPAEFIEQLRRVGAVIAGQSRDVTPADKAIYALRDVTGTVESIPLIASSVMSKKIASGADAFVLDVKVGRGAFMKELSQAQALAEAMIGIARLSRRRAVAWITSMEQPLGCAVGNALEVAEAIEALKGEGPRDVEELVVALAGEMIYLGEKAADPGEGKKRAAEILRSGAALAKFRELVAAQGGDPGVVDDPESLLVAPVKADVAAPSGGWVAAVDSYAVGLATMALGAGRVRKEDAIDPSVGIVLRKKVGDAVRPGESLATVHARSDEEADTAATAVLGAYSIESQPAKPPALLIQRLES